MENTSCPLKSNISRSTVLPEEAPFGDTAEEKRVCSTMLMLNIFLSHNQLCFELVRLFIYICLFHIIYEKRFLLFSSTAIRELM
ncbi:hypothetical protein GE061_010935 [Apolygus lucorum]|uniref:Uncharacterized protein n=1 Tax=Apolygus lucorum TaxID=248454 RepID=A0A8S9XY78_APOLU|nr:hypothetical protein GE061_010935 [Apolygus lucorum]